MMPVWVSPKFAILGKIVKFYLKLAKNWKIFVESIFCDALVYDFCTLTIDNITKVISYDAKLNVLKNFYFGIK